MPDPHAGALHAVARTVYGIIALAACRQAAATATAAKARRIVLLVQLATMIGPKWQCLQGVNIWAGAAAAHSSRPLTRSVRPGPRLSMAAADDDACQIVAELAVAVVLRILSPAMTTQPQVLMDRAFAVLVNNGSHGKPTHNCQSEWGSLLRAITRWALLGIPREAAVSANAFGQALEAEGVGPFGAAVATAMARAVMLSAAIVDPQMFDSIVAEAVVSGLVARVDGRVGSPERRSTDCFRPTAT